MALSNIFQEPRREITESVVGIVVGSCVLSLIGLLDHLVAVVLMHIHFDVGKYDPQPVDIVFFHFAAVFALVVGGVGLWIFFHATHSIGEDICDAFAKRGLELRPKIRK